MFQKQRLWIQHHDSCYVLACQQSTLLNSWWPSVSALRKEMWKAFLYVHSCLSATQQRALHKICVETRFLRRRKIKVTYIMQVAKLTSLPGLQAHTLKSGWNAQFCGMDILDFKWLNLLNSQTLEISQSFLCSYRIRDCRKKSVSKKLYLGNLHHRTFGGSIWQLSTKPLHTEHRLRRQ